LPGFYVAAVVAVHRERKPEDPATSRARARRWATAHPERAAAKNAAWRAANPERVRQHNARSNREQSLDRFVGKFSL